MKSLSNQHTMSTSKGNNCLSTKMGKMIERVLNRILLIRTYTQHPLVHGLSLEWCMFHLRTTGRNRSNYNRRPDHTQQNATTQNGARRYSCKLGNIPGTARNSDKNQAATLMFNDDETRDSRFAALTI